MTIFADDIKYVASAVMDDVPEGGGPPTSHIIPDGLTNSIFQDVSEKDRAFGAFDARKLFVHVQTPNTDTYMGGHLIVSKGPDDSNVSIVLAAASSFFDRRSDIKNRVEQYLAPGPEFNGFLFGNHYNGQRSVQLFQRPTVGGPNVGSTLMLRQVNGSQVTEQYVRLTDVALAVRTFSYSVSASVVDYTAQVATAGISDPLRTDFTGSPANRLFERSGSGAAVYETVVADAAKYYSVADLVEPVTQGDLKCKVKSIYKQLVPSAQTEIPVIDTSAAGQSTALVTSATGTVTLSTQLPFTPNTSIFLGNPATPGTLSIPVSGGTISDAAGALVIGGSKIGTIDYARGLLTWASDSPGYVGAKNIVYKPAAAPLQLADSASIAVGPENRANNYTMTVVPPPAPGTARVSYMANGTWYELRDNGAGQLRGADSSYGVGSVDYSTGTILVSFNVLPDAGSDVVFQWGGKSNFTNRSGGTPAATIAVQLAKGGISPNSLSINWNDGQARSVSDNGRGVLTGAMTGTVDYNAGIATLAPVTLPDAAQSYAAAFDRGEPSTETLAKVPRNITGTVDIALAAGNIRPGTFDMSWPVIIIGPNNFDGALYPGSTAIQQLGVSNKTVRDNGSGALVDASGVNFGTINYATGAVHFLPDFAQTIPQPTFLAWAAGTAPKTGGGYEPTFRVGFSGVSSILANSTMPVDNTVNIKYRVTGASTGATDTPSASTLTLDLTANYAERVVPGSVRFTLGGKTYVDRSGLLYVDIDPATGAGTAAGRIDYATGICTITLWTAGASAVAQIQSLLVLVTNIAGVDAVTFRTPVAPLRPGSLQILATRLDGTTLNVRASNAGVITGTNVSGTVNYETGVVRLRFGAWVTAAGNENAAWYNPEAVRDDGKIFKPAAVWPDTIRYSAVAYTYLPLDANLLGIDPVRLPQDGLVPIFRKGDGIVIGNKGVTPAATVQAGQTINCGRVRLSRVRVVGADGKTIAKGYTTQLNAGTVTFTDVTDYVQPVTIEHRIEDLIVLSDVGIDGTLSFVSHASHDYPAGAPSSSYVSSALMFDDLKARVSTLFAQSTWTNEWSDSLLGNAPDGRYNDTLYPLIVTNLGAVTERWRIQFITTSTYNLFGEHLGLVVAGQSINVDCSPINPATGVPYVVIRAAGFGQGGFIAQNVVRFNTVGALVPAWLFRSVQMGPETVVDDRWELLVRGDVDRP
ncbi:hypothetical protein [Variovorax sp. PAMC26660]|uniref:hypothetical protein n=1 Tax=Variovorax sp. PAMC26660 TaxID=2762322 RepID=UPI00164E9AD1|nr:hypothetical protein [Variovorax sp. PAMC26660]QNK69189.1 hypothetical protein H7F35_05605 [Variovorax sp. PAMC26660]